MNTVSARLVHSGIAMIYVDEKPVGVAKKYTTNSLHGSFTYWQFAYSEDAGGKQDGATATDLYLLVEKFQRLVNLQNPPQVS